MFCSCWSCASAASTSGVITCLGGLKTMHCVFIETSRTTLNALYPKETNLLDHSGLDFDLNTTPKKTNYNGNYYVAIPA